MSEREKMMRDSYQKRRKGWIIFQSIIIGIVTIALIFGSLVYYSASKDTYVPYTQKSNVIYKAYLADNAFYEQEYLNGSHAYVASLVEKMTADFEYKLNISQADVKFKYSYKIDAQVEVRDKDSQMAIFNPTFELVPTQTLKGKGSVVKINDLVELDYKKYNKLAKDFIASYSLDQVESFLIVRMYVNVLGESEKFVEDNKNSYTVELFVPLNKNTVTPLVVTPTEAEAEKILTFNTKNTNVLKTVVLITALLDIVLIIILSIYVRSTRDKHIDYARKVKHIVSSYTSYIQKIKNAIDTNGYQVLNVDTFNEMLEIRDTLQNPILMFENRDRTRTQFFIINGNILYLYEISVKEDFDSLEDFEEWEESFEESLTK